METEAFNQTQTNKFRGEILSRIYRVWLFRKFLPVLVIEIIIFSLALYLFGRAVFVESVLDNALGVFFLNPPRIINFFVSAFAHTLFLTKIAVLVSVVLGALLIRLLTQGILRFILVRKNYFGKTKS